MARRAAIAITALVTTVMLVATVIRSPSGSDRELKVARLSRGGRRAANSVLNDTIIAHLHQAKTAGSSLNHHAARTYERVCGWKGYSFDQKFEPVWFDPGQKTEEGYPRKHNRYHVPWDMMASRGFYDCDLLSLETPWQTYVERMPKRRQILWLLPVRSPLNWLIGNCYFKEGAHPLMNDTVEDVRQRKKPCSALAACDDWPKSAVARFNESMLSPSSYSWGPAVKACHFEYADFAATLRHMEELGLLEERRYYVKPFDNLNPVVESKEAKSAKPAKAEVEQACIGAPGLEETATARYVRYVKHRTPHCQTMLLDADGRIL